MKLSIEQVQELAELQKRLAKLYKGGGLCGIREDGVHMNDEVFIETFNTFAVVFDMSFTEYPYELSTVAGGVKFYAILNVEELADLENTHPDKFEFISKALQEEPS